MKKKIYRRPFPRLSLREISIFQGLIKLNISNQVSQVHICFVVNLIIFNFKYYMIQLNMSIENCPKLRKFFFQGSFMIYLGFPFICLANIIILLSSEIKKNISSKTTQNF